MPAFETTFGAEALADFARASALEWLETDGTGGYASSSVSGAHARRYHGLLIAATEPPVGRKVLVSRLDETLRVPGATAVELGANCFPGAIHPRGHERMVQFHRCLFPRWNFEAAGVRLRKSIGMLDGEATTVALYEVLEAPGRSRSRCGRFSPAATTTGWHAPRLGRARPLSLALARCASASRTRCPTSS
jgi:hypothetical protein